MKPETSPMNADRKTSSTRAVRAKQKLSLEHRIATLLHTMRCITQHEDRLCELLKAVKDAPDMTKDLVADLHDLLDKLPAQDYTHDLESLRDIPAINGPAPRRKK